MVTAYLALGSNLGDSVQHIEWATAALAQLPSTRLLAKSSLYKSKPVDASGNDYINAVLAIDTALNAYALLGELQKLETLSGRALPADRAHAHNAPRTLDIDILLFGDASIDSQTLTIPHPRMWQRAFVLRPLAELAPQRVRAIDLQAVAQQKICQLASGDLS